MHYHIDGICHSTLLQTLGKELRKASGPSMVLVTGSTLGPSGDHVQSVPCPAQACLPQPDFPLSSAFIGLVVTMPHGSGWVTLALQAVHMHGLHSARHLYACVHASDLCHCKSNFQWFDIPSRASLFEALNKPDLLLVAFAILSGSPWPCNCAAVSEKVCCRRPIKDSQAISSTGTRPLHAVWPAQCHQSPVA